MRGIFSEPRSIGEKKPLRNFAESSSLLRKLVSGREQTSFNMQITQAFLTEHCGKNAKTGTSNLARTIMVFAPRTRLALTFCLHGKLPIQANCVVSVKIKIIRENRVKARRIKAISYASC